MKKFRRKVKTLIALTIQNLYWRRRYRTLYQAYRKTAASRSPDANYQVVFNRYGGYCVPSEAIHRPAARSVAMGLVHEYDTINFMRNNMGGGDVVHAGTFFGDFLPALSAACGESGTVWAFEPNRGNYQCAACTIELNQLSNVKLLHAGVGASNQNTLIKTADATGGALGGGSHIINDNGRRDRTGLEEVQLVRIDDTVPSDRKISIIQLDVEGHEIEALKGAMETIRRWHPTLILETRPGYNLADDEWFVANILGNHYQETTTVHRNAVYTFSAPRSGG